MPGPEQSVLDAERIRRLHLMIQTLPAEQKTIIELRFGLNGNEVHTVAGVARLLGLTHPRVSKLQAKTLKALRAASGLESSESF
jgi:RNA polymerase sigma factor (sigma-70 family)